MVDKTRKRSPNWLLSEKTLLLDLVESHLNVIENKKTDSASLKQKHAEWQIISTEYNCQTSNCLRTAENLKAQWESLKKAAKKHEVARTYFLKAGGEHGLEAKKKDPLHETILKLIKASAVGPCNSIDSDSVDVESVGGNNNQNSEEIVQDWSIFTNKNLKPPICKPLKRSLRRRPMYSAQTSLHQLHKKKMEAIEIQKSMAEKEISNLKEAHKLDILIKREQFKQEKIKTRILLLDLEKKQLEKQ